MHADAQTHRKHAQTHSYTDNALYSQHRPCTAHFATFDAWADNSIKGLLTNRHSNSQFTILME